MKCPYCRTITNKLLPFIVHTDVIRKLGVNHPQKYCMKLHDCSWYVKSGKNKNNLCNKSAYESDHGIYCFTHQNMCNLKLQKIDKIKYIENNWTENHIKVNKKYNIKQLKQLIIDMNNNNTSISKYRIVVGGTKKELVAKTLLYELINLDNL